MKPSDIKKMKAQSEKVKVANKKFAAAAAKDKSLKNSSDGNGNQDKDVSGFVSFEGEHPKFKYYMFVESKVQI